MLKVAKLHQQEDAARIRVVIAGGGFDEVDLASVNQQYSDNVIIVEK